MWSLSLCIHFHSNKCILYLDFEQIRRVVTLPMALKSMSPKKSYGQLDPPITTEESLLQSVRWVEAIISPIHWHLGVRSSEDRHVDWWFWDKVLFGFFDGGPWHGRKIVVPVPGIMMLDVVPGIMMLDVGIADGLYVELWCWDAWIMMLTTKLFRQLVEDDEWWVKREKWFLFIFFI